MPPPQGLPWQEGPATWPVIRDPPAPHKARPAALVPRPPSPTGNPRDARPPPCTSKGSAPPVPEHLRGPGHHDTRGSAHRDFRGPAFFDEKRGSAYDEEARGSARRGDRGDFEDTRTRGSAYREEARGSAHGEQARGSAHDGRQAAAAAEAAAEARDILIRRDPRLTFFAFGAAYPWGHNGPNARGDHAPDRERTWNEFVQMQGLSTSSFQRVLDEFPWSHIISIDCSALELFLFLFLLLLYIY